MSWISWSIEFGQRLLVISTCFSIVSASFPRKEQYELLLTQKLFWGWDRRHASKELLMDLHPHLSSFLKCYCSCLEDGKHEKNALSHSPSLWHWSFAEPVCFAFLWDLFASSSSSSCFVLKPVGLRIIVKGDPQQGVTCCSSAPKCGKVSDKWELVLDCSGYAGCLSNKLVCLCWMCCAMVHHTCYIEFLQIGTLAAVILVTTVRGDLVAARLLSTPIVLYSFWYSSCDSHCSAVDIEDFYPTSLQRWFKVSMLAETNAWLAWCFSCLYASNRILLYGQFDIPTSLIAGWRLPSDMPDIVQLNHTRVKTILWRAQRASCAQALSCCTYFFVVSLGFLLRAG